ncbi:hypothetical protein [Spiroplasma sp. ChiS]|uniref:hypothetical protein n=1 Tax=Spiroplasma sp. ChiS TaxID=2099885 RepID=UPI001F174C05|nr:hypothetical protein [Spiroplasma sp. ChiS]
MYGTIGRYVQKNIDDQIEPKSFGQGTIKNNLELFNQTSSLPSYSEAIINSQSDNQVSGLPSYSERKWNI